MAETHWHGAYEFFDHAADVGFQVHGNSLPALFALAARALMDWIGPAPEGANSSNRELELEADDREQLLVRWLQELLYEFQYRHFYPQDVQTLTMTETTLRATLLSSSWEESSYHRYREVKAVTYHKLKVVYEGDTWKATIILDV